jgi:formylglycine-generating enzyme
MTTYLKKLLSLFAILLWAGIPNYVFGQAVKKSKSKMALIPAATFEMGTDKAEIPKLQEMFKIKRAALFEEETPRRRVKIDSFYLDKTEVTNADFKSFLDKNPAWRKDKIPAEFHNGKYLQDWNGTDFPKEKANHPVTFVIWYAAVAYCQSQKKRLPTEAEWEFAARGGLSGKQFPWGDEMPDKTRANFGASEIGAATAVGSYAPSDYGLFDMTGNVWEFLADEWQTYPANSELQINPVAGGDFFYKDSFREIKTRRVIRGGSFGGGTVNLRVTYRDSHLPENAGDHVGFRCAESLNENPSKAAAINELLKLQKQARVAHFTHNGKLLVSTFADDFTSISNGKIQKPTREASLTRFQNYLNNSTFLEWDDITPPVIKVSDDVTLGYVLVNKKVRLLAKNENGTETEETEIFAWIEIYRKLKGEWKLTAVVSTNTPEADK